MSKTNDSELHGQTMEKAQFMTEEQLREVCEAMGVKHCRELLVPRDAREEMLDALCDASWDGLHGDTADFDARLWHLVSQTVG